VITGDAAVFHGLSSVRALTDLLPPACLVNALEPRVFLDAARSGWLCERVVATSDTDSEGRCPQCGRRVDALRAGAVSIVAGKIVHFCSAACREAHLRPGEGPQVPAVEPEPEVDIGPEPAVREETEPLSSIEDGSLPDRPRPTLTLSSALLVDGIAILLLVGFGVAVVVLPRGALGGRLSPGIVAAACLAALVLDVVGARRQGLARMVEASAIPIAALALAAIAAIQSGARLPAMFALALLLAERAGRVVELAGRNRSGIVEVLEGSPPLLLASEWRDNSAIAARVRHVTLVLEWARFPLAALFGLAIWFLDGGLALALLAGATALVAANTRALRMTTGDAHLSVALSAARRGVVIRDAHAVERVGAARMILFIARRSLVEPTVKVVDWQWAGEIDEGSVLAALAGVESRVEGRIAEAMIEFVTSQGIAPRDVEEVEIEPGAGVAALTPYGALICGGRGMMLSADVSTAEHEDWARTVEQTGRRAVFVALEGRVVGMFAVEEEPVEGAAEVARGLSVLGLEPAMITSAEVDAGQALGERLEIENVRFETGEDRLSALLPDITGTGDTVLLVGHGPAFEQNLRSATAGFALGSEEPTMAGVDARKRGIREVLRVVTAARGARRSVRLNLVAAVIAAAAGLALAFSWQSPIVAGFVCALGCATSALATFNGPYPMLERLVLRVKQTYARVLRIVGIKRTAAP
jgi:hypothetical protein